MAWVARNSDNTTRTPSAYERHNNANGDVAGGLLGRNAFERHNSDNSDDTQPTSITGTDAFGNQYKNWNGDYEAHNVNNEGLRVTTALSVSGTYQVGQTLTITNATATGGDGTIVYLIQKRVSDTGTGGWVNTVLQSSAAAGEVLTHVIPAEDLGKYIQIRARIRDNNNVVPYTQIFSNAPVGGPVIAA